MEKRAKQLIITSVILTIVNAVLAILILMLKQDFTARGYSDALFISGFSTFLLYLLRFLGSKGSFDLLTYTAVRFRDTFRKEPLKTYEDAYEYLDFKREERRKKQTNFWPHFIVPLVFIITAIILAFI